MISVISPASDCGQTFIKRAICRSSCVHFVRASCHNFLRLSFNSGCFVVLIEFASIDKSIISSTLSRILVPKMNRHFFGTYFSFPMKLANLSCSFEPVSIGSNGVPLRFLAYTPLIDFDYLFFPQGASWQTRHCLIERLTPPLFGSRRAREAQWTRHCRPQSPRSPQGTRTWSCRNMQKPPTSACVRRRGRRPSFSLYSC